ncbi:hypothetical protein MLD38_036081 [Melastoma candidum]|uniref:Uncharacterized protein n=1 Tax=Melastoma candidum TaxID=119954 RepID=A0ACB9LKF3_9MYRT|nr:hypothetical protein MLD38_036081 [Melastoma candidum]
MPSKISVQFSEDFEFIERGVKKLKHQLQGDPEAIVTVTEKMSLYKCGYPISLPLASASLYDMAAIDVGPIFSFAESNIGFVSCVVTGHFHQLPASVVQVLPSLREKSDEEVLRQLIERRAIHKIMLQKLFMYFQYLDRYYVSRASIPPLRVVGITCFHDLVARQQEGKPFDRSIIKSVLDIVVQLGIESGFEEAMLTETATYYSNKASSLLRELSYREYMLKFNLCYRKMPGGGMPAAGKDGVSCYLNASSEAALVEVCRLFVVHLGAYDEVTRVFANTRAFISYILACSVLQHVHTEAITLARDAATNGLEFIQKAINLHEKCLKRSTMFSSGSATQLSGELLASFCDDLLKKDSGKRLTDKAIEETLEKAVKLLPYVYAKDHFLKLYWENLVRRLLSGGANDGRERNILAKIKLQIGNCFQHPMKRIIRNVFWTRSFLYNSLTRILLLGGRYHLDEGKPIEPPGIY